MFRRNFLLVLLGWLLTTIEKIGLGEEKSSVANTLLNTSAIAIYVDPNGADSHSVAEVLAGGIDRPLASWSRAVEMVRELRSQSDRPIEVIFRSGTYLISQPVIFTPADSGTQLSPITYRSASGEQAVFSGGRRITGWRTNRLKQQRLWVVDLPPEFQGVKFQHLWVNNQRRGRSRYPSQGYLKVKSVNNRQGKPWSKGDRSFQYHQSDFPTDIDPVGSEAVVLSRWLDYRLPVQQIQRQQQTLQFGKESVFQILSDDLYYLENSWNFFDTPGEWYLDHQRQRLFYLPMAGESLANTEIVVPVLTTLVKLVGAPKERSYVSHLRFCNLNFAHTDWHLPAKRSGYNQNAWGIEAAVFANGIRDCRWQGCTFQHLGNYGIELFRGCQHNQITNCSFFDLGAGAIKVGERQTYVPKIEPTEVSHHNNLSYNHVYDCGKFFPSAVGIRVAQSHHNTIAHNHVHDLYYTGISARGTWGFAATEAHSNTIEHNHVHHIGRLSNGEGPILSDMGGIYTMGTQPNTVIRHNRIHDVYGLRYGGWGIYLDEGSSYLLVAHNLVYRLSHNAFFQHYGKENLIRNNIFAFGGEFQLHRDRRDRQYARQDNFISFRFINNIVYWQDGRFSTNSAEDLRYKAVFERNIYWKVNQPDFLIAYIPWSQWHANDPHSQVVDPLFINPDRGDFRLQPHSPAYQLGFGSKN